MTPSQQASLAAILMDLRAGQSLYYAPFHRPVSRVTAVGAVDGEPEWCATLEDDDLVDLYYAEPDQFIVGARVEIPE